MVPTTAPRAAAVSLVACAVLCVGAQGRGAERSAALDPLAQAVVDSLSFPPRTEPRELLDAALRAAEVEAHDVAVRYFAKLTRRLEEAGDKREELQADLGDRVEAGRLRRFERLVRDAADADGVASVVRGILEASARRRRDPARLRRAADQLADTSVSRRAAGYERLSAAGVDALPHLVELLQTDDAPRREGRAIARRLVRELGATARQPLLAWLGSDDVAHWPGIIEALDATVTADAPIDFVEYLLAPAVVPDSPEAVRGRAIGLLRRVASAGSMSLDPLPPSAATAATFVARRLDRTLSVDGLPEADHLSPEPVVDPADAQAAEGRTVERVVWDPQEGRLVRWNMPPRVARAQAARHLARDLVALGATDPHTVRLVLLAQIEALLATTPDPGAGLDIPPEQLVGTLTGPNGFSREDAAGVCDLAASRGLLSAAAAAARAVGLPPPGVAPIVPAPTRTTRTPAAPANQLSPAVRSTLLRAIVVPDAALQFEAARALAVAAGDPPYHGSSRVTEILVHAATSTGDDVVVVAHHDAEVRESLASGLSRFGYRPEKVAAGRDAILAARASADSMLVVLGARTIHPSALETVQLIQRQPFGDVPPVLVVVDPLDDDARGRFLTKLLLGFADLDCVGVTDRLDSLFLPQFDATSGAVVGPPRFPDRLAAVAGTAAVNPRLRLSRARARRVRAAAALEVLADLGRRGWDVAAVEPAAQRALMRPADAAGAADLFTPAAAVLGTIGSPRAQQALLAATAAETLPETSRNRVLAAFAQSVDRHGVLLECRPLREVAARYNRSATAADRSAAEAVLDILQKPSRTPRPAPVDAARTAPKR